MPLSDLPTEILRTILEYASCGVQKRQLYSYRLVNRFFEVEINRVCWKKRCWQTSVEASGDSGAFVYSEDRNVEGELRIAISSFLLSSQVIENDLQLDLRIAMAVLMNTKELVIQGSHQEDAQKKIKLSITDEDGLLEKYKDPDSQNRFLEIVDLLVATVCCVSGSGLTCSDWYPRKVVDNLEFDSRSNWSDLYSNPLHFPNLDWALATTAFIEDTHAFKAILSTFHTSGEALTLSEQYEDPLVRLRPRRPEIEKTAPVWVSALTVAIRNNDYELATLLLSNCPNLVNAYTLVPPHENSLEIACQQGSLQMVNLILDPRWGLDYASWHAYYAVQHAARCPCSRDGPANCDERIAIIYTLLPLLSPERDCRKLKNEVLRQACKWGCMTLVRTMVEDLDSQPVSFDGMALGCAAMHGHIEVMEYLLNHSTGHLSPLFSVYMVEFMQTGADLDMLNYLEETKSFILTYGALEPAKAQYLLAAAKAKNCPKVVELFTRGGVSV